MDSLRFARSFRIIAVLLLTSLALVVPHVTNAQEDDGTAIVTQFERSPDGSGIRMEIVGEPESEIILLRHPDRVALDLTKTVTAVRPPALDAEDALKSIRDGLVSRETYRVLFELARPAVPTFETSTQDGKTVLELSFAPASEAQYAQAVAERVGQIVRPDEAGTVNAGERRYTVVVDPGHGGEDLGAVGEGGTLEKELNLAFALVLRDALQAGGAPIDVVLTRENDTLIPLAERSAMARRAGADLFVSIHADSIRYKDLRGATVYTLSARASDALASEIAEGENAADRFAGPEFTEDTPEIHDILVDLVKRETESLSQSFADELVVEMRSADIRLINNPKRSAGFRVLMAPDVPSVLLEMGYLSNVEDEKLMQTRDWQENTAEVLAEAITGFLQTRSALGTQ